MTDTIGKYLLFSIFIVSSVYHIYACCIKEQDDMVLKLQALDWVIASSVMIYFLIKYNLNEELLILIIPTLTVHGVTFFIEHKYYPCLHTLWHIGGGLIALKIIEQNSKKKIQI